MKNSQIAKLGDFYSMFRNKDYSYETIFDGDIFMAYPRYFNDPFDCMFFIERCEFEIEYLKKFYGENIIDDELIETTIKSKNNSIFYQIELLKSLTNVNINKNLERYADLFKLNLEQIKKNCHVLLKKYIDKLDDIRNKYGVACFTLNKPTENMVMWAHYADNYDGFCCKFNFGNVKLEPSKRPSYKDYLIKHFKKVKYTTKFEQLSCKKLLNIDIDDLYNNKYVNDYISKTLYKKHAQWRYENEYRLVIDRTTCPYVANENNNGFKIKFKYLRELFIYANKRSLQKELVVREIAKKYNVKYFKLINRRGHVGLQEDKSEINEHNKLIDLYNYNDHE